ncbi:DUF6018 family natural product bioysynthesis protein [Ferdinandcohnia sp. SAFN-114]|uniref:DUF6018 family natural product bioysynthesis protein n=1 Tax=Ferdinandcohnia sp. SAFN-114 TaxID=3387275 RepID=UPI003F7D44F4
MAQTMAELFNKGDVIEDCRKMVLSKGRHQRARVSAEIILKDGTRRFYRCLSIESDEAYNEVLTFVKAIEDATGESVVWRFKGDKTYHLGCTQPIQVENSKLLSKLSKLRDGFMGFFFPEA